MRAQPAASHHIDGRYVEDAAGAAIESLYPATGEAIARVHAATPDVIARAVCAAKAAQPGWAALTGAERGRILRRAAELMRARNRELSVLETLDTGKPIQETLVADAASGADCLEYFGGISTDIAGDHIQLGNNFVFTRREPLGVCAGIAAWNYPMQIACWKAAPALACGNAMVLKPSELTPLSTLKLAECLTEAGLPAGVFNVVQGRGDVGEALVAHPDVAKVSLTGSVATGARVLAQAGALLKPATLELGGKSPLILFEDADLEQAVTGAMLANFYSAGQVCSNGTRVFVQAGARDRFLDRLVARTHRIRLGDPLDPATQMGPLVSSAQRDRVLDAIRAGVQEGARLLHGGKSPKLQGLEKGYFVEPTIFAGVTDAMRIAREEMFGPVLSVLEFTDEAEVIARANALDVGLAAGVFTRDLARAHRVIGRIEAGTCWINTYNVTPVEMAFGGVKRSGIGRENGRAAIEHYTRLKSVYVETGSISSPYD